MIIDARRESQDRGAIQAGIQKHGPRKDGGPVEKNLGPGFFNAFPGYIIRVHGETARGENQITPEIFEF
jgi:hypothetical protein